MDSRVDCNHVLTDVDEFGELYCLECGDSVEETEEVDEEREYDYEV